ncbi:MAG TPA: M20/M25/M40 family metallo-hydrolase [Ferruginibacter sp.]|nr:M20/M25/M40 family metallo-hydrolase [Ferruginibacter sp.]HMP21031.1 M20/M25/M40 family metallo-hydrolase [Ferruginibacter sp.]
MISRLISFFTALILACPVFAQNADSLTIRKITNDILSNGGAYENLRYLCKKIGPRLSGSANAQKAVEATAQMLKAAGADTVYLQPCMVPHWVRGTKETGFITMANGARRILKLCALGNSTGTGTKGITAPVVEVKSLDELEQLGEKMVKGKIVFINLPMNPTHIRTFKAYGESGKARVQGPSKAAKYGAVAVMVRSLASNPDDYPHTGVTQYNDSFPKIPAVAISTNDAEWLSRQLKLKIQLKAFVQTNCMLLPDAPSFNVVGEIRGSEKPEEIITVGGHLDSWDLAEGAHDDGAGCVQSIEIIRVLKALGIKPKRTIRAVMFMNEENGGKGADKYLELAKENKEQHIFALESDAGGFSPRGFSIDATDTQYESILQWKPLLYEYGVYNFTRGGSGADVGKLKKIGAATAGLEPDSQRYFDVHHASTDVFEAVSRRELHLGAAAMAAIIFLADKYGL